MKSTKNPKKDKMNVFFDKKNNRISTTGLTIIELLVTITILVATATTILVLGDRAVSHAGLFTAYTQATFLAKEGVEILSDRDIRDEIRNGIEEDEDWNGVGFWHVDYKGNADPKDENSCKKKMRINIDNLYAIGGDEETPFSRCITIWAVDEIDDLKTQTDVSFDYKGSDYSVTLYRIFYD